MRFYADFEQIHHTSVFEIEAETLWLSNGLVQVCETQKACFADLKFDLKGMIHFLQRPMISFAQDAMWTRVRGSVDPDP